MLIKNIFIELRSRLRSCNVFITTGVDFTKNCNLKISIQANCIVLNYYKDDSDTSKRRDSLSSIESLSDCYSEDDDEEVSCVIPIQEFCQIIPNSMSCLKIDNSSISFRILTEPKNGGNFYKELLSTNNLDTTNTKRNLLKLNVIVGDELKITCANCSNVLSNAGVKFDRILELPTENLDMSEWFCHGHGHSHSHGDSSQHENIELKTNKTDFLYRLTFFVVSNSVLTDKTNKFNSKREVYHCNRCLAWLGLKNKDKVKLFNSEVKIQQNDIEKSVFAVKPLPSIHTNDFIYTIENVTREFNLGFQYTVMCKIILECTISASKKQYLLIWVMDKELQVLRNSVDKILSEKIELQSSFVTKILYKVEFCMNEEVEAWLSDPGVVSTDISKGMFTNGLAHLQKMSLKVPESFRNTNGYCVSYLKV